MAAAEEAMGGERADPSRASCAAAVGIGNRARELGATAYPHLGNQKTVSSLGKKG
uniref:Uncharacterized protein n=1 Tax=Oryza sativa subsp. japonica TaxID=39947 RepID=Q6K7T4_ORYSJ|nr:hypothetical protein [Oryza sativa Japonica Group]